MTRSVLVTGASGFIGRRVLPLLTAAGWQVHATARTPPSDPLADGSVVWHGADLLAEGVPRALVREVRPSHLLHLAWTAQPGVFWADPANLLWTAATLQLAHAFAEAGGSRLVAVGTCAEYDWSAGLCTEESTPLRPATPYGAAKLATVTALGPWAATAGVDLVWARLFHLYGPGEPEGKLIGSVVRSLRAGDEVALTSGEQLRDFLHVDDAARGLVSLLERGPAQVLNLASGEAVAVRDLVERLGRASGRVELLRFGARPTPEGEPALLVADVSRAHATGWRPQTSLEDGLPRLLLDEP